MARVLILDDVADAVAVISKIIERKGHEAVGFTDEEEAIAYARAHAVDLAILGIKLKRMNGIEVLAEIKRINPSIKVIMLTGYPTLETAAEAMRLGADGYYVKPVEKAELEHRVARLLPG